jgi:phage recombination protein Bet
MNARTIEEARVDDMLLASEGGPVAVFNPPRLPWHPAVEDRFGVDRGGWKVLVEAIFPNAKTADAVVMALSYCKARNLDVFKRPVNIVPMWNSSLGREVETVWPSINEIQTSAARTGNWAGMDEPKWGRDITNTFEGRRKTREGWESTQVTVVFPEWCAVTVYRLVSGQRYAFTEPVYWKEAYSRAGGAKSQLPTDMWVKRPRGQLHKVAKAASLRAAFPEEGEYAAEEMEGKEIEANGIMIEHEPKPPSPPKLPPAARAQPLSHDPVTGEIWDDEFVAAAERGPATPPSPPRSPQASTQSRVGAPDDAAKAAPSAVQQDGRPQQSGAADDFPEIPENLDRRSRKPMPSDDGDPDFDGEDWLVNLEGAFSGVAEGDTTGLKDKQDKYMTPYLPRATKAQRQRAQKMLTKYAMQVAGLTTMDAG